MRINLQGAGGTEKTCLYVSTYVNIKYILDRRLGAGGFPEADMCDSRGGFIQYQSPLL